MDTTMKQFSMTREEAIEIIRRFLEHDKIDVYAVIVSSIAFIAWMIVFDLWMKMIVNEKWKLRFLKTIKTFLITPFVEIISLPFKLMPKKKKKKVKKIKIKISDNEKNHLVKSDRIPERKKTVNISYRDRKRAKGNWGWD